ncbi:MAG: O-antigen ligase family protein [Nitrospiraceae bacterium]
MQIGRQQAKLAITAGRSMPVRKEGRETGAKRGFGFYLVLVSLLVEFGRPQDIIPGIKVIPFPSIIDLLIGVTVVMSGKLNVENKQTKLYIGLLILMVGHVPFATNNYWAAMVLKDMLLYFCFFLGIVAFVDTIEKMKTLVNAWLMVHLVLAILGIMSGGKGVGGWLGDENDFCMEMNVAVPFAYFMLLGAQSKASRVLYLSSLCIFILTAMVTLSRGGFIGLAAVGFYCWLKSSKKGRAVVLVGVVIIFMLIFAPEKYWEEIQSTTDERTLTVGTGAERLYTWGIGLDMFLGNPIFGVGQGNFPWNFQEYQGEDRFNERSLAGRAAHSMYFTLIPEMGFVGALMFFLMAWNNYTTVSRLRMLGRAILKSGSNDRAKEEQDIAFGVSVGSALEAAMIGYLVSSVFISTLWYPTFWIITALTVALGNLYLNKRPAGELSAAKSAIPRLPKSSFPTGMTRPRPAR